MELRALRISPLLQAYPTTSSRDSRRLGQRMSFQTFPVSIQFSVLYTQRELFFQMESWHTVLPLLCGVCFCFNVVCRRHLSCTKCRIMSSLLAIAWCSVVWLLHGWFHQFAINEYTVLFHFSSIKNNTSLNILVHTSLFVFLWIDLKTNYKLVFSMSFWTTRGKKSNNIKEKKNF